jgi:ParB family transcriptional regulator, chromosome partitioning protein
MKLDLACLDQFKASALLGDVPVCAEAPSEISLELIDFDPTQPRRSIDEATLAELALSIREKGVLEPVSLRTNPERPGRYIVNRGERRVRASRLAGRATVPWFLDERIDPYAQAIENLQREALSPFDLAQFISDREREGDSRAEIARRLAKPASFITEAAGLIDAPATVRAVFEEGRARDTRVLYQLARGSRDNPSAVESLLDKAEPLTRETVDRALRETEKEIRRVECTKLACSILVEHAGRRGRLGLKGQPGRRLAQIEFDDGSRQAVELGELKLVAWAGRQS